MKLRLSLCIPTYNRGGFLAETIESIVAQQHEAVEIIISDNASEDQTEEIVRGYQALHPRITYHRWERNMGADANYLKVVELALGDFCWFIGSDDLLEPGAVNTLLKVLSGHESITGLTVNRYDGSYDMSVKQDASFGMPQITKKPFDRDLWFCEGSDAFYSICDYFGYIAAQIVNRERWNAVVASSDVQAYFQGYVHVYIIAEMLKRYGCWAYVHQPCICWRMGNDSFLRNGLYYRMSILIESHEAIISTVWRGYPKLQRDTKRLILKIHAKNYIGGAYLRTPLDQKIERHFFSKSFFLCLKYYWDEPFFWLHIVPFFVVPRTLVFFIRNRWRVLKSIFSKNGQ